MYKFVVNSQGVEKCKVGAWCARAIGHPGNILHQDGGKMALSQPCSNPAAFQELSYICMMV